MASGSVQIHPMRAADAAQVVALADRGLGPGYYDADTVMQLVQRSTLHGRTFSYVARTMDADTREPARIVGARFTLPPGRWSSGRGEGLHPERWPYERGVPAYFQSCFVDPAWTGRGIGGQLARRAIDDLAAAGVRLAVTHAWKESPHGSSRRYLERLGFVAVAEHGDYWSGVDYHCPRCGDACRCTAIEMVLSIEA